MMVASTMIGWPTHMCLAWLTVELFGLRDNPYRHSGSQCITWAQDIGNVYMDKATLAALLTGPGDRRWRFGDSAVS